MAPKFGTSGIRGLVSELTPDLVAAYVSSFVRTCDTGGRLFVGRDLRESSPAIADVVKDTARALGQDVVDCGALPTPALALAASQAKAGAIMITGSHIPADRNGIKFYTTQGEISKDDEARINAALGAEEAQAVSLGQLHDGAAAAGQAYVARYTDVFGPDALAGLKIGVYQHSSVARDLLCEMLSGLGADVVALERSDHFVPVDTEAVEPEARAKCAEWCQAHELDALVSTDGDADRPMLTDAQGQLVPGDVLGALTARYLGAEVICTPVSSNTMIREMPAFDALHWTRIGSPHVIAAMDAVDAQRKTVGYEANGGFLLGFAYESAGAVMAPLKTRDCALPMVATLVCAKSEGLSVADLVATLPKRFTAADRIQGVATDRSLALIAMLTADAQARRAFFETDEDEVSVDTTDGLRVRFANADVVHLRPSGNAPEFRCYAEAGSAARAQHLVSRHLQKLGARLET